MLQTRQVRARGIQRGAIADHCGLCAAQVGADRAVIDAGQQLALAHLLAFLEQHLGEYPIDLRPQYGALQRLHRAHAAAPMRHIALLDAAGHHRHRRRRAGRLRVAA